MVSSMSAKDVRNIAIFSQGLNGKASSVSDVFSRVKCIQLDPLNNVRASHELVCLSRGAERSEAKLLLNNYASSVSFIYPGHALAILPIAHWPWFAFMRRRVKEWGWRGPSPLPESIAMVRSLLAEKKTISSRDFKDGTGTGWARSSSLRVAAEWLLWAGEIICVSRAGVFREYSFAEHVVPPGLFSDERTDHECICYLVSEAIDALGVASLHDIADYFRLPKKMIEDALKELEVPQIRVEGWGCSAWISSQAQSYSGLTAKKLVPLSPFDSLIWYRPRLKRIFGKQYLLEAYKPAAKRSFGHYFVPILAGDNIIGRVAPRRVEGELVIEARESDNTEYDSLIDEGIKILKSWAED